LDAAHIGGKQRAPYWKKGTVADEEVALSRADVVIEDEQEVAE